MKVLSTVLIGAVEYTLSDRDENVVVARYISSASVAEAEGVVCRGRAEGDTSNGFPGDYVIRYYGVEDELLILCDWHIEAVGDTFRLTWSQRADPECAWLPVEPGTVIFEGFGFATSEKTIVVSYWLTEAGSEAFRLAREGVSA